MRFSTLLCILLISCQFANEQPTEVIENDHKEVTTEIEKLFAASGISGMSVMVLQNGKRIFEHNAGFANIEKQQKYTSKSIQNIASVSKTLIAVSIMKAVDLDKVELDADINQYLPFAVRNPNHPDVPITLRQLATHTSSIFDSDDYMRSYYFLNGEELTSTDFNEGYQEYLELIQQNELIDESQFLKNMLKQDGPWASEDVYAKEAPGQVNEYSNVAATLAAYVVEQATGTFYEDFTKEYIFKPLGMTNTFWDINTHSNPQFATKYFSKEMAVPDYYLITKADGGLYTCTEDFSKFMLEMSKGFRGQGTLLSKDSYNTMFTPQFEEDGEATGIFWELDPENRSYNHSGGDPGVTTNVAYNAEKDISMIMFTNIEGTDETFGQIVDIWNAMKGVFKEQNE